MYRDLEATVAYATLICTFYYYYYYYNQAKDSLTLVYQQAHNRLFLNSYTVLCNAKSFNCTWVLLSITSFVPFLP